MSQELLINGDNAFARIIERIRAAKETIYINMFIWRDDQIGNEIAREILDAADRGVSIKIVKDKVGSVFEKSEEVKQSLFHKQFDFGIFLQQYVMAKCYFGYVKKLDGRQRGNQYLEKILSHDNIDIDANNKRNDHSKFYIFDNKILIMGGVNIEDKEVSFDMLQRKWADYMIEIVDENIVDRFLKKLEAKENMLKNEAFDFYFNLNSKGIFQVKPKTLEIMENTRVSLDIEMAYFGDRDVTQKIIECANRGVKVSMITSKVSNIQNALNHYVLDMISRETQNKVDIYLSKRVVHAKLICADNETFFFGSANFNKRGMASLSELNVLVKNDRALIDRWRAWRNQHLKECEQYSSRNKPVYSKPMAIMESLFC